MTPQDPGQSGHDSGAGFHASRYDETTRLSHLIHSYVSSPHLVATDAPGSFLVSVTGSPRIQEHYRDTSASVTNVIAISSVT